MADYAGINGDRKDFKIVGRLTHVMATGKAKYGSDVVVPDMLHAKFMRSPYRHAKVKSIDLSKARKLPGIVDILTWEDPDIKEIYRMGSPPNFPMM